MTSETQLWRDSRLGYDNLKLKDIHEIAQHTTQVHHARLKKILSDDYVMARLSDQEREYVTDSFAFAMQYRNIIPHETTANETFNMIMDHVNGLVIMSRNRGDNYLLKLIFEHAMATEDEDRIRELERSDSPEGFLTRLRNRLRKRKTSANEED